MHTNEVVQAAPARPLDIAIVAAGFHLEPVAPIADLKAIAEDGCSNCSAKVHLRAYWRGAHCRLVVECPRCFLTEER